MGKTAKEVIRLLELDGWKEVKPRNAGSHRQFKHKTKKGKTTVAVHGNNEIPIGTLKRIELQSGIKLT